MPVPAPTAMCTVAPTLRGGGLLPLPACVAGAGAVGAYLVLYTGWSKAKGAFSLDALLDVVLVRQGAGHTMDQLNKVLGLAGITSLGLASIPGAIDRPLELRKIAAGLLVPHACFSLWRYWGTKIPGWLNWNPIKDATSKDANKNVAWKRRFATVQGAEALLLLLLSVTTGFWDRKLPNFLTPAWVLYGLIVALSHFYFIEVDAKWKLPVRPAGYAGFVVPGVAAILWLSHIVQARLH
eukprot:NODE_373_length_2155_cov_122.856600_g298_i0.p2 GENE.NODE_373_length_2155_cov_122.856600_g298_i0~~NODE_373_length_2155_cov_122.856600_g298_i0.p2  ORF type:complete len:238 (-),score=49.45 NODE_373_length_2155_cov_122.856600_g298_i0:1314-2027(-)